MQLERKIAVITGASGGIGRAIAIRLAREGATIVVHYAGSADAAAETVRGVQAEGQEAFALPADIGSVAEIQKFYESLDAELTKRTGSANFDILVNNAGMGTFAPVEATTPELYDRIMGVNLKGAFFMTQQALPRLRDGGRIISISAGLSKHPSPDLAVYSMAKAGINALTALVAARQGKRGITANAIGPGPINTAASKPITSDPEQLKRVTGMTALGRIGEPQDIASIAAFLASPDSGWITGQFIDASGGYGL